MEHILTQSDLGLHLAEYLRRVSQEHERFVVVENGKRIAEINPVREAPMLKDLPRIMANVPHLDPDDAEQFAKDLEEIRRTMNGEKLQKPWES